MQTELITTDVWHSLTSAAKRARAKSVIAVAYFGKGGSKMLPLKRGSILLVDASENAVKSGQTFPAELLKLYYKGVKIYSHKNLHAKMFVVGNALFIGSTNVSGRSSSFLTEALFKINERKSVTEAKKFIKSLCKVEIGDEHLKRLQKFYRSPRIAGGKRGAAILDTRKMDRPAALYTYHLNLINFKEEEVQQSKEGKKEAERKRISKSRHIVDEFLWTRNFTARKKDVIVQVVNEGNNTYIIPPGLLIHTRKWKKGNINKVLCYVEIPDKRRKNIGFVNEKLNTKGVKQLKRNGKQPEWFAEKILDLWK